MSFSHPNNGQAVVDGQPITAQQLTAVFDAIPSAIDGDGGGAYAPTARLVIGGSGIMDASIDVLDVNSGAIVNHTTTKHRVHVNFGTLCPDIRVTFQPGALGETRTLYIDEIHPGTRISLLIAGGLVSGGTFTATTRMRSITMIAMRAVEAGGELWQVVSATEGRFTTGDHELVSSSSSFNARLDSNGRYPLVENSIKLFGTYEGNISFQVPSKPGLDSVPREVKIYVHELKSIGGARARVSIYEGNGNVGWLDVGSGAQRLSVTFVRQSDSIWSATEINSFEWRRQHAYGQVAARGGAENTDVIVEIDAAAARTWRVTGDVLMRTITFEGNVSPLATLYRFGLSQPFEDGQEVDVMFDRMRHYVQSPVRFEQRNSDGAWTVIDGSTRTLNASGYSSDGPATYTFKAIGGQWRFKGITH